jgi:hypothetical protein
MLTIDRARAERKDVADRIKTQCVLNNYGLPEHAEQIGLGNLSIDDARREIKAIRELWVRLDLWIATGEASSGSIQYPEARRRIDYSLSAKNPDNTTVFFKALTRDKKRR